MPPNASTIPKAPPRHPRTTLSTSSCRTTRQRDAPRATRTAISRERFAARDSSRLATFAHAISSTKPTAPIIARKICRIGPPLKRWLNVITSAVGKSLLVSGYLVACAAAMRSISAWPWPWVAPAFNRPKICIPRWSRRSASGGWRAIHIAALDGNFIPSGITPMIVAGSPLTRSGRPSTFGSAP